MDSIGGDPGDWLAAHGARLVLFARQWVGNHQDAEDAFQQAFVPKTRSRICTVAFGTQHRIIRVRHGAGGITNRRPDGNGHLRLKIVKRKHCRRKSNRRSPIFRLNSVKWSC